VTFRWKDYAHGNCQRVMTLEAVEFIRRFLLHVLPRGFQRILHYAFLANSVRQEKLALCRQLLRPSVVLRPPAVQMCATFGDRPFIPPQYLSLSQLPDRSLGGRRDALPPPRDLGLVCPSPLFDTS
jgi:Putative transposase